MCVNGVTIISITDLDCVNETSGSDEMNVMYEHEDDPESVDSGSDTEESPVPEVGMVTNSDMHEAALSRMSRMNLEHQPADITDDQAISEFWTSGCGCSKWNGKNCVRQFSISFIQEVRMQCQELSHSELDLIILGQLQAFMNNSDIVSVESRHKANSRVRQYFAYHHQGKPVSLQMFLFLHSIGSKRLKNLFTSFQKQGILPRVHGNSKRLPPHTLSFSSVEHVVSFIVNYAEENSILLPGRIPGYKACDMKLLPSSNSKKEIWRFYETASLARDDIHVVAYTTFCRLWKLLLPDIIMMRPMSDLCWNCQQNSHLILRSANSTDIEKTINLDNALEHLRVVAVERSFFRSIVGDCSSSIRSQYSSNGSFQPPSLSSKIPENSKKIKGHYSFDYAQMVRVW